MPIQPVQVNTVAASQSAAIDVPPANFGQAYVQTAVAELEQLRASSTQESAESRTLALKQRRGAIAKERNAVDLGVVAHIVQAAVAILVTVVSSIDGVSKSAKSLVSGIGNGLQSILTSVLGFMSQKRVGQAKRLDQSAADIDRVAETADKSSKISADDIRALHQQADAARDAEHADSVAAMS